MQGGPHVPLTHDLTLVDIPPMPHVTLHGPETHAVHELGLPIINKIMSLDDESSNSAVKRGSICTRKEAIHFRRTDFIVIHSKPTEQAVKLMLGPPSQLPHEPPVHSRVWFY